MLIVLELDYCIRHVFLASLITSCSTDTSDTGLGAMLLQEGNGTLFPVAFASNTFVSLLLYIFVSLLLYIFVSLLLYIFVSLLLYIFVSFLLYIFVSLLLYIFVSLLLCYYTVC